MLPIGENAEKIKVLPYLPSSPGCHVVVGNYVFGTQSKAFGQTIKDGGHVVVHYTP